MTSSSYRFGAALLLGLFLLFFFAPAQGADADTPDEATVARTDEMLDAYLAASAEDLVIEYLAIENLSMMLDLGFNVVTPKLEINDSNREMMRARIAAQREAMAEAIEARGAADIAGRYTAEATPACSKIPSMWAGGLREGYLGTPTIEQQGHEATMIQLVRRDANAPMDTAVVIVENVLVFTDMMNSDFVFKGLVEGEVITVRPDADRILAAWPDWVKAPSRKNLESCKVTLTRE